MNRALNADQKIAGAVWTVPRTTSLVSCSRAKESGSQTHFGTPSSGAPVEPCRQPLGVGGGPEDEWRAFRASVVVLHLTKVDD